LLPGVSSCGVFLFSEAGELVASGATLAGTEQPCVLTPQYAQTIGMIDAELGWHLLLTTTGAESQRIIRINPAVDLPDEIHPIYADDGLALVRATAGIDAAAHYIDDLTASCPLGLGAGLGDVVSVPVDGVAVVGQAESITWAGTPNGAQEQAVIRRHVAIAPAPAIAPPAPPVIVNDAGETTADETTSGNVLANDASGLMVTAVNGLSANVGATVAGNNGGMFVISSTGAWTFDPGIDFAALTDSETAETSVTYHASNGAAEASATLTITVSSGSALPLWTPAQITTAVWRDDSGEDGPDFNGSALQATDNIVLPVFCAVFAAIDTSSITTTQVAIEHSTNYNNNSGSFLLTVGEASGHINYGFNGSNGKYVLRYPISNGKLTLSLLHHSARSLSVYNHGALLTGTSVDTGGTTFPANTSSLPVYTRARAGDMFPLSGTVREVIILGAVPSIGTRQRIEGYLAHKWDRILGESARVAALPSGHPYKVEAPRLPNLWTPDEITTALWLDAADITSLTLDGTAVSQWADKSGNNRHATSTLTARPVVTEASLNGLRTITFDGSNDYLSVGTALGKPTNYTIFVVGRITKALSSFQNLTMSCNSLGTMDTSWGAIRNHSSWPGQTNWIYGNGSGASRYGTGAGAFVLNEWAIHGLLHQNGVQNETAYKDGAALTNGNLTGAATVVAGTAHDLSLGRAGAYSDHYLGGGIAEVIICTSALSVTAQQRIEGYLAHKWGRVAQLPSDHPYKDNPPTI
jgi:hypothetical protein